MKDLTLDEMLEIAAERESANEALYQQLNSQQTDDNSKLETQLGKTEEN